LGEEGSDGDWHEGVGGGRLAVYVWGKYMAVTGDWEEEEAAEKGEGEGEGGQGGCEDFSVVDADGSGFITILELGEAMRRFDTRVSDTEVESRFQEMDKDRDGHVTREEFLAWRYLHGFEDMDTDASGAISREELWSAMSRVDPHVSAEEANLLFTALDADGDGSVSREEFVVWQSRKFQREQWGIDKDPGEGRGEGGHCAYDTVQDEDDDWDIDYLRCGNTLATH
jgi:Ca2+-binding EF-hand superfamily protein